MVTYFSIHPAIQNENSIVKHLMMIAIIRPSFKNMIFPSKQDIEEFEIKGLFGTYVSQGEFAGLNASIMHDTCILINQKRSENSK